MSQHDRCYGTSGLDRKSATLTMDEGKSKSLTEEALRHSVRKTDLQADLSRRRRGTDRTECSAEALNECEMDSEPGLAQDRL